MIPAFAIGSYAAGFALALLFAWRGAWRLIGIAFAAVVLVFVICWFAPRNGDGYADIGYAIVAFLICMPAGGGLLSGAILGWLVNRARRSPD